MGSGAELGELPSVVVGSCGEVLVAGSRVRVYTEQGQMVGRGGTELTAQHFRELAAYNFRELKASNFKELKAPN